MAKSLEPCTSSQARPDVIAKGWIVSVNTGPGGVPRYPRSGGDWLTPRGLRTDLRAFAKHNKPSRVLSILSMDLLRHFQQAGFAVYPGAMAENVTTEGIDLMQLPLGCEIEFGSGAVVRLDEYRKPCYQLDPLGGELKETAVGRCGLLCSFVREGPVVPGAQVVVYAGAAAEGQEAMKDSAGRTSGTPVGS